MGKNAFRRIEDSKEVPYNIKRSGPLAGRVRTDRGMVGRSLYHAPRFLRAKYLRTTLPVSCSGRVQRA